VNDPTIVDNYLGSFGLKTKSIHTRHDLHGDATNIGRRMRLSHRVSYAIITALVLAG
jgi:hypothetical protein